MFCPKCGNKVRQNELYCDKCGNFLGSNFNNNLNPIIDKTNSINTINNQYCNSRELKLKITSNKKIYVGIGISLLIFLCVILITANNGKYYFSTDNRDSTEEIVNSPNTDTQVVKKGKYSTVIVTDNTYSGVKVYTNQDANKLIVDDSVKQKDNCPSEIKTIENEIISKYGITAVNLCEMDINFAKEISNVFKKIYNEYPSVRGYLTNLTLTNASLSEGYIAAFMPVFTFATSSSKSTYPWVIKTQILLNTTYFLNATRLEASVKDSSSSGHFPPNATMYSPVAHELGHYLSFLAMMKNYKLDSILMINDNNDEKFYDVYNDFAKGTYSFVMITEAYNKYKSEVGTTLDIDTWRGQISNYALAKDKNGEYIYDETIAEAFHDVYLNGDNANLVSKYVTNVLKSKLEG